MLVILAAALGLATGLYMLSIYIAPSFSSNGAAKAVAAQPKDDRIIIPDADINVPIGEGNASILKKEAWHRFPDRGDPEKGGNFIVSGHRFVMSYNPIKTMNQSYFYNLDKVKEGDAVFINWHGKRYDYKVTRKYTVKPNQTDIENPSQQAKLTIYTCTLGGTYDGRVVVEAAPNF
jgi:sortase A